MTIFNVQYSSIAHIIRIQRECINTIPNYYGHSYKVLYEYLKLYLYEYKHACVFPCKTSHKNNSMKD